MSEITVYQTDSQGVFIHTSAAYPFPLAPDVYNIPYGAYVDEPPAAGDGLAARRNATDDGWEVVADNRLATLYYQHSPATEEEPAVYAQYAFGVTVEVDGAPVMYGGLGEVPDWLMSEKPADDNEAPETPLIG